jgi:hypothetical protein
MLAPTKPLEPRPDDDGRWRCPECETKGADVLPSRMRCQTCLKARMDYLDRVWPP